MLEFSARHCKQILDYQGRESVNCVSILATCCVVSTSPVANFTKKQCTVHLVVIINAVVVIASGVMKDMAAPDTGWSKDCIAQYSRLLSRGDLSGLLEMFSDDAVIYEPFSKIGAAKGKQEIEPFLQVMISSVKGSKISYTIEKIDYDHMVSAVWTFEKGGRIRMKFIIEFDAGNHKIKTLNIERHVAQTKA